MLGGPVRPVSSRLTPLAQDEIRITGGFWGEKQSLNADTIIEHCRTWMERIGWIANFDRVADGTIESSHTGIEFVDSEVYKLLEAMAWELARKPSPELQSRFEGIVRRVAAVQDADGYLHTSFGRPGQRPRYSDLEWGHELYCFGHLIQAAVARLRTGHDDLLVSTARKLADHVYREFGPEGRNAICGHPEIETALAEFTRATGDDRYRDLAQLFLERRGHRTLKTTLFQGHEYFLDDTPVREATVLRGHAVRALYLSAGAVDIASDTADQQLLSAVQRQWDRTVARRTYITGGMGAHHQNEEFGHDYELPADRAYSETCAGIASVMLGWRLLLETGSAKYADLMERTLLNNVLASPREDGRAFYYTNTLHQRIPGEVLAQDELSERAEASMRAPWFEVSCCPTNVARTLASIHSYFATTDDDGIQLHQFADLDIATTTGNGQPVSLTVRTAYPLKGQVLITVLEEAHLTLGIRIPSWARGAATASVNDEPVPVDGDYLTITHDFTPGSTVQISLPMEARIVFPSPRIDGIRGTAAIERGPLVLCLESVDLPEHASFDDIAIDSHQIPQTTDDGATLTARLRQGGRWDDWPYRAPSANATDSTLDISLRPYYRWANRGPSAMRVWIPTTSDSD